jgi:predicted ATPase
MMSVGPPFFVAVTGAQGVGKSTFCHALVSRLQQAGREDVRLFDGLGDNLKAMGVPLGSKSTPQTIFAVWATHLEREASVAGGLVVLDRCIVDALAYTRVLNLSSELERRVLEQAAILAAERLGFVVHLECSTFFADKRGSHETAEDRRRVADEIGVVLSQLDLPRICLRAEDPMSVGAALDVILSLAKRA